jgi:hypothetical protein
MHFNVITVDQAAYLAGLVVSLVGVTKVYLPSRGGYTNNVRLESVLVGILVTLLAVYRVHGFSAYLIDAAGDGVTLGAAATAGVAAVKATQHRFSTGAPAPAPAAESAPEQAAA